MQTFTAPVVGAHFHPPAKALLKYIPSNAALTLRREPENPYDENAVMVYVGMEIIPEELHGELEAETTNYGFSLEELLEQSPWHLGYIGRDYAVHLAPLLDQSPPEEVTIFFGMDGKPQAKITMDL